MRRSGCGRRSRTRTGVELGIGPWGEERAVYAGQMLPIGVRTGHAAHSLIWGSTCSRRRDRRCCTPLDGTVVDVSSSATPLGYGHAVLLEHEPDGRALSTACGAISRMQTVDATARSASSSRPASVIGQIGGAARKRQLAAACASPAHHLSAGPRGRHHRCGRGSYRRPVGGAVPRSDAFRRPCRRRHSTRAARPRTMRSSARKSKLMPQSEHLLPQAAEDRARRRRLAD